MTIIGYTDSLSMASGDTLALKGSTRETRFDARLVLLHTAGGTRHPGRLASERALPRGLLAFERGLPREGAAASNGVISPIESLPRLAERRLSLWLHMSTVSNPAALLVWDADNVVFLGSDAIAEVRLGGQSFKAEKALDLRYWYKLTACFVAGTREFVLRVEDARWYRKVEEVRQPYDGKPPSSGGSELLTAGCAGRLSAQLAIPPPRLWTTRRSCLRQPPQSTGRFPCVDRPTPTPPTGAHPSKSRQCGTAGPCPPISQLDLSSERSGLRSGLGWCKSDASAEQAVHQTSQSRNALALGRPQQQERPL